ncbi:MAG: archaellin/type IV pilin N-terminal domain-containing protein [archaeon]
MNLKVKKGVSPVVATVLLIAIVVMIAIIIFLWARGFVKETFEKQGKPAYQACEQVNLEIVLSTSNTGNLEVVNRGNIPIYMVDLKKIGSGRVETQSEKIELGQSQSVVLTDNEGDFTSYDVIEIVPILLGKRGDQKSIKHCIDNTIKVQV